MIKFNFWTKVYFPKIDKELGKKIGVFIDKDNNIFYSMNDGNLEIDDT